jgi:hypothetical protein
MPRSQAWKGNERQWAKTLCDFKLPAKRISRAGNFGLSTYDVSIDGADHVISDGKYSQSGFLICRQVREAAQKYAKKPTDFVVILSKGYRDVGQTASTSDLTLALLLAYWEGAGTREELYQIYQDRVKKRARSSSEGNEEERTKRRASARTEPEPI